MPYNKDGSRKRGFLMKGWDSGVSSFNKNGPTDDDKKLMQRLMEQYNKATSAQDKLRIRNQMEKLGGM